MTTSVLTLGDLRGAWLDLVALAWFLLVIVGYRLLTHTRSLARRSITGAVQAQRVAWLVNMAHRENRMLDAIVLTSLSQGNAFFTSTSAIGIGGVAALMGSGDKLQDVLQQLPFAAPSGPALFELKLAVLMGVFVYAFFKFAWAFRLSHYTAIMIGATPLATETSAESCELHARRTARLIGIAADHANAGLRSFYYAIAALLWLVHPVAFVIATTWVLAILVRREFFSRSRAVIAGTWP